MAITLTTPVTTPVDTPQIAEAIHERVDGFMEAVPPLTKALDEVAKIHPFISGGISSHLARYRMPDEDLSC